MEKPALVSSETFNLLLDRVWTAKPDTKLAVADSITRNITKEDAKDLDEFLALSWSKSETTASRQEIIVILQYIRDHMDSLLLWKREDRDRFLETFVQTLHMNISEFWALYRTWHNIPTH